MKNDLVVMLMAKRIIFFLNAMQMALNVVLEKEVSYFL